jgi:hypothetical protein
VDPGVSPSNLGGGLAGSTPADAVRAIAEINALPATVAGPNAVAADGFQVAWVSANAIGAGEHRLFVYQGISDDRLVRVANDVYRIPGDAFAHTDPVAVVVLEARLADGRPLPDWLIFDRVLGTLSGEPPAGQAGELEIEVIARDAEGREARTWFKHSIEAIRAAGGGAVPVAQDTELGLDVDEKEAEKARAAAARAATEAGSGTAKSGDGKARPQGAAGFSEQLKGAKAQRDPLLDRIAKPSDTTRRGR